jgi:hypothetical protein
MIIRKPWILDFNDLAAIAEDVANRCEMLVEEEIESRTKEVAERAVSAYRAEIADGLTITSILANHKKNAFTVVWADGTSTVIHCQPGDKWDDEKALAMCFVKKIAGNKGNFNDIFTEIMPAKIKRIGSVEEAEAERDNNGNVITDDMVLFTKKTKKLGRKLEQAGAAAAKASGSLHEMAVAMADAASTKDTAKDAKTYNLYLGCVSSCTKRGSNLSADDIFKKIRAIIHENYPECDINPLRAWCDNGPLTIDFGRSSYFLIPGMTMDEWVSQFH